MKSSQHSRRVAFPRWLFWGTLILGLFVICDIALFGVLIFRSLSQRVLNDIVLEAQAEAEEMAEQIKDDAERRGYDLWTAIATESDTQTYIDQVLSQRKIVERVEIRDREGRIVFQNVREETQGEEELPVADPDLDAPRIETRRFVREIPFAEVEVPVGEFGSFVIGISRTELEARLKVLRRDLIGQARWIAGLTVILFVAASLLIWFLAVRSQRMQEKADEAERLAYVGSLASGLAHEIRSPLNSLNLNMQMLEEEAREGHGWSSGRRLMAITRSEISRLEGLVNDFLAYARPSHPEFEVCRAGRLVEHAVEVLRAQLRAEGVEVTIEDHSGGALIKADRDQINQLLLNLMLNSVEAARDAKRRGEIRLELRLDGFSVVIAVHDNGVGLSEEQQARMFELFYSTRKGGTGLGLAIVERIAQSHGGTLAVRSTPGRGTSVELRLPVADRPPRVLRAVTAGGFGSAPSEAAPSPRSGRFPAASTRR